MAKKVEITEATLYSQKGHLPHLDEGAWVAPGARVIGLVHLGYDASVWYNCVLRGDVEKIVIGERSNIQDLTVIHADEGEPTIVGKEVTVGHSAILHGCTIGDRCLIGMGSTILNLANIGEESIIGAGTLITKGKSYPPRSLIMGSPGKVVRELTEEEVKDIRESADKYVKYAKNHKTFVRPSYPVSVVTLDIEEDGM